MAGYSLLTPSCQRIWLNGVVTGWAGVPLQPRQDGAVYISVSFCVLPPPHLRLFLEQWDLSSIPLSLTSVPVRGSPSPLLPKCAVCSLSRSPADVSKKNSQLERAGRLLRSLSAWHLLLRRQAFTLSGGLGAVGSRRSQRGYRSALIL